MVRTSQTASVEPIDDSDEATPQRGATRAPVRRPVRLQFDDAIDVVEAMCHNVSIGGMFVHSTEGRPVGALVRFELMLEDEASIRGLAEVVWMRSQDQGGERVAGMGLKFRFLEQRDRQLIFKLVSQHIKERLAARHPGLSEDQAEEEPPKPPPIRAAASTVERVSRAPEPPAATAPLATPPAPSAPYEAPSPSSADRQSAEALPSIDDFEPDAGDYEPAEDESGQRRLTFGGVSAGDSPSSAWMQDGLSDERSPVDVTLGGREDHDSEYDEEYDPQYESDPSYAPLEGEGYESHLYEDEEHFEHRPRPRRDIPVLTLAALLVTALAVSVYLWGDRWFGGDQAEDVMPAPAAESASDAQVASSPEASGIGSDDGSAASSDEATNGEAAPAESATESETEPARVVDTGLPFVAAEPVAPPPPRQREVSPPPDEPARSRSSATSQPFRIVRDISARVAGPAVEIVITTDGRISADRFSHARISGGAPRELIRLRGLSQRFDTESIPVGIGTVRQVRTGWHRKSSGNELHVVIDLSSPTAKVTSVRVEGSTIVASIQ